jgi:hypothetical protein
VSKLAVCVSILLLVSAGPGWTEQQPPTYKLSGYGALCNGQHDDTAAFKAAAAASAKSCIEVNNDEWYQSVLEFPHRGSCIFNSPISVDASCSKLETNGSVLRFPKGSGVTFTSSHPINPYGDNLAIKEELHVVGPGKSGTSGTYGVRLNAANLVFTSLDVNGFNYGVQIGDNSYMISLYHPNLWGNGTGLYCPTGLKNSGENISGFGGAIFNNAVGVDNQGCDIVLLSTSLDYNSVSAVKDAANPSNGAATGSVSLVGVNVEFGVVTGPVFQLGINGTGSNCNGFDFILVEGGKVHATVFPHGPNAVALVDNDTCRVPGLRSGGTVTIRDAWVAGIQPSGNCVAGTSGTNCVIGNNARQVKLIDLHDDSGHWFTWNQ